MHSLILALLLGAVVVPGPTVPQTGSITTAKLADGAVTTAKLASGAVTDATVSASAAIARSKLATGTANTLVSDDGTGAFSALACTAGQIVSANATPAPVCETMSGDATIATGGALTIANSAITDAKVSASAAIARSKLATGTANALITDDGTGALGTLTCTAGQIMVASVTPAPACVSMSGDATIAAGGALTLASSGVTAASYGDASHSVTVAFDAKGRATSASAPAIAIGEAAVTSLTTDLGAKVAKSGDTMTGTLTSAPTLDTNDLVLKGTTAVGPVSDIFDVESSDGLTNYMKIDHTGASTFRGTVTATTFAGALAGNATTATTATNFSGNLSGDVTGTQGATVVAKINGVALGTTTATSGNILVADGSQWATKPASGDATLASTGAFTVVGLHGATVSAAAPNANDVLEYTGGSWTPTAQVSQQAFAAGGTITGTIDVEAVIQTAFTGTITLPAASTGLQRVTITDAASTVSTGDTVKIAAAGADHIIYDHWAASLTSMDLVADGGRIMLVSDGGGKWRVATRSGWAFDPSTISGLSLWLVSYLGITQAGGTVSQWNDQSGNANNAVQATGANQPAYNTTTNYLPTLYFNGTSSFMTIPNAASLQPGTGGWTVAVAARVGNTQGGDFPEFIGSRAWASSSEAGWAFALQSSTFLVGSHFYDGVNGHDVSTDLSGNTAHGMTSWVMVEDLTNAKTQFWRNGIMDTANAPAMPSANIAQTDTIYIAHDKAGGTRWLQAYIGEIVVVKGALSVVNGNLLADYLHVKWDTN